MRQIKFRGKRVDGKGWVYGSYLLVQGNNFIIPIDTKMVKIFGSRHVHWDDLVEVIPETVGQFTGLTDKNGKEIYEGDIIKYFNHRFAEPFVHEVKYHSEYTSFSIPNLESMEDFEPEEGIEIIGNIHDNPQLIKNA